MKYYIIKVHHKTGIGSDADTYEFEYSGAIHTRKSDAERELRIAKKQCGNNAYMEVLED